ncbi:hypothetical protein N9954_08935 [Maribacter sp.]|nr:hypothetical protein [Maribacter sp.]
MKTFLVSLYCSLFFLVQPSKTANFSIENGQLIWQKVYATELSKEQLIQEIRNSGTFKNSSVFEEKLTAEISELYLDYDGYGEKSLLPPLNSRYIKSYVIIDFKENKYRVTLKSIKLTPIITGGESYDSTIALERVALQKEGGGFKDKFLKKTSKIMDFTFQKITHFKEIEKKDDW